MSRSSVTWARAGAVLALMLSIMLGAFGNSAAVGAQTSSTDETGVSGSTYTSPSFGYSFEWDRSWDVKDEKVEDDYNMLYLDDGSSLPYDLFLGVPRHRVPAVVVDSGMSKDGWIPVNPRTLETLRQFLPVPIEGLTREFAEGATPDDVCARTIRALRDAGVKHIYVSNLPVNKARQTLARILSKIGP